MDPLPDWAELPHHLLDSVLDRLNFLQDCLQFSVVCKSWYCVAKENINQRAKLPSFHAPPLLLINIHRGETWMAYNVMDCKLLDLELRMPNTRFCGSSKGWLMFVEDDFSVTLINPFSRVRGREKENSIIRLPQLIHLTEDDQDYRERHEYFVHKVTMSADPLLNPNDCIVVVITQPLANMAFIRVGRDRCWTYVLQEDQDDWGFKVDCGFEEAVFLEDKFYGVQRNGRLSSLEIDACSNWGLKFAANKLPQKSHGMRYLVYSADKKEMMMVLRYRSRDDEIRTYTTEDFEVYKLNVNKCKWIKKKTLGGLALFLGDNSSVSVLASSFPGCLPNCIYFLQESDCLYQGGKKDFGVYNMAAKEFLPTDETAVSDLVMMSNRPAIWVLPTFHL